MSQRLLILLLIGLLGGCARTAVTLVDHAQLPARAELVDVPFYPQQDYQCGPAALATMLAQRDIEATPEALVEQVYIPKRKGSLQVEMVAAARSAGLLVYPLQPSLSDLLAEVAAGNPVLVLQNLAFDRWPQWHFAVVVGYDLAEQKIILRSGTTKRLVVSFHEFERSWRKAERWAVLTLQPQQVPQTAQETVWLRSASDLEEVGQVRAARAAYEVGAKRWNSALTQFALANSQYAAGEKAAAEESLRISVRLDPGFAIGWFNLSQVMAERGCDSGARQAQACAMRMDPDDARLRAPLPVQESQHAAQCLPSPPCVSK
ncbi:PA2778 family cysteine peptidase [Pseudomonas stutzeri]|uniref:PA2778 family cysteine peptidase n=1 Tax=Stutzerimonas stutzeri TaxID=316 RepID=UPI001909095B|nr:PA2778 family cysteine peptidase [Stutzerimonas stutzeri]MBK3880975.1 PA2778 family cysteine peptidase [Stutzerimonas stutzeri]